MGPPGPGPVWSPGDAWSFAWNVVTKRFSTVALPFAVGYLAMALPVGILYGVVIVSTQLLNDLIEPSMLGIVMSGMFGVVGLAFGFVQAFMMGGFVSTALKAARGQPTSFSDPFSGGRFLGAFIVAGLVGGILIGLGYLLCVVPGLILAFGLWLTPHLIVDQGLSGIDALKRSWELTMGHKLLIFLFYLIGILVILAGELACGVGVILISLPMFFVAHAYLYLRIKGENPPVPSG